MSAIAVRRPTSRALRVAWLVTGLTAATLARAAVNGLSPVSSFLGGAGFGLALLCLALGAGWQPTRPAPRSLVIGIAGGALLVGVALLTGPGALVGMRPEPFVAWVVVTALVAITEEILLRGALLDAVDELAGPAAAVVASSLAFALMHVPLYGWSVVPIDFAAGVLLAGLRDLGRGVAAPAVAHLVADLATWWL